MIDDKYLQLMHAEIDGVNTPQQSAKLREYLGQRPEAQRLYEELTAATALLQELKPVEPPPHLQHAIMHALPPRVQFQQHFDFKAWLREWVSPAFELKTALAFSGGLAIGLVFLILFTHRGLETEVSENSKLYGTIGLQHAGSGIEKTVRVVIQDAELHGTASLQHTGNQLSVIFSLSAPQPFDLSVAYDAAALSFTGVDVLEAGVISNLSVQNGTITFSPLSSKAFVVVFAKRTPAPAKIGLRALRAGSLIYENQISE